MKELTELELTDLWKEVKEDFWGDISLQTQKMVKKLMETTLEEEMRAYIGISHMDAVRIEKAIVMVFIQGAYLPLLDIFLKYLSADRQESATLS